MGKKSKSKSKKKAAASAPVQAPTPAAPPASRPAPARAPKPAKVGGGGGTGTSSSKPTQKERDDARIERAARQFAPQNPLLEFAIDNPTQAPGWYPDRDSVLETALSDKHSDILSQMLAHDEKMVKVVDRVDEVHWKGNHAKSIRMATEAIETNEAFVRSLYGVQIAYTPIHHIQAFQVRCHSRKQVGDYGAAIDDATEALAMIQSRKNMVDRPEFPVQKMEARLLFDRGDVLLKNAGWGEAKLTSIAKDAFDAGLRDIRAALAVARASRQWWRNREAGDIIDIDEVSALFICVMATKKVQSGATRPFYSAQSLVSFCKDACVGPYSFERHVCLGCGAAPTDGTGLQTKPVELRTCDKCLQFWFCSKECLSKTWKSIHKPLCKPDNAFGGRGKLAYWYVSDFEKNFIDDKIDTFGAFCVPRAKRDKDDSSSLAESHEQDLPFAICRDANGLYFDQFTDHPFIFLPSQATRMFEVGVSVDKSYDLMLDSVGYLTNLSQTMTARQKSNFRKLTMKHMRLRNQARKYPDVAAKLADQMRMLSTMQE